MSSNTTTSTNMALTIPVVGVDPGPQYATDTNNCLTIIDGHDHSPGYGVSITPAGLSLTSDLTFLSNNATNVRSVRFTPQNTTFSTVADIGCVYESGVDLYYRDGSGNNIRITQSGSLAGAAGTITGLPSGTASASYVAGTFIFQSATATPANVDGESFILRNNAANSKGLTLSPPNAMASNYSITLPVLPSGNNTILTIDTSGNISPAMVLDNSTLVNVSGTLQVATGGITGLQIAGATITSGNIAGASITGSNIAANTITGGNIATSTIASGNLINSINLPGTNVTANGHNLIVSATNASNNLQIIRGSVNSGGTKINGEGFSASRSGAGAYNITFSLSFLSPPVIMAIVDAGTGNSGGWTALTSSLAAGSFNIQTINTSLAPADQNFSFIAIGIQS